MWSFLNLGIDGYCPEGTFPGAAAPNKGAFLQRAIISVSHPPIMQKLLDTRAS